MESYEWIGTSVTARPAREGEIIECSAVGRVLTERGQWVVEVPDAGSRLIMSTEVFEALFAPPGADSSP